MLYGFYCLNHFERLTPLLQVAVFGRLDSLSGTNQDKKPSRTLLQLPQSQAEYMSVKLLTKSLAPDKDVFVLLTLSSDRCFKDKTQNVN